MQNKQNMQNEQNILTNENVHNIDENKYLNPEYINELIENILKFKLSKQDIAKKKVELCRKYKLKKIPSDIEILLNLDKKTSMTARKFLETKPVRTGSGVAVIAIMSAPFRCPHGKCTYCQGLHFHCDKGQHVVVNGTSICPVTSGHQVLEELDFLEPSFFG